MNQAHIKQLSAYLDEKNLSMACITSTANVFYLSGFYCNPHERLLALLVFPKADPILVCPKMEINRAQKGGWDHEIIGFTDTENPWEFIQVRLQKGAHPIKSIAIEEEQLTVAKYHALKAAFSDARIENISPWLQESRLKKDSLEIERIKKAAKVADIGIQAGVDVLKEGVTELEVASKIDLAMKKAGMEKASFDPAVLFGKKTADPHGMPGENKLQKGDFVLFDIGAVVDGYCSDITRTFVFGRPSDEQTNIYNAVLEANLAAIDQCKTDQKMAGIDSAARQRIEEKGYGPFFTHRVGHGLGIEIHEIPSMHGENSRTLENGMVVTIEPGIYNPEVGGVRIEDDVVIVDGKAEVLTHFPKAFQIVGE